MQFLKKRVHCVDSVALGSGPKSCQDASTRPNTLHQQGVCTATGVHVSSGTVNSGKNNYHTHRVVLVCDIGKVTRDL